MTTVADASAGSLPGSTPSLESGSLDVQRHAAYRPEIDGLRSLAVISVFVFHLGGALVPGGFVGVDIFFVISGFLITGLLLANIEAGTFSLVVFYQRRIARIAPALFLVLTFTLAAAGLIYAAQDFGSVGAMASFAAMSLVNMKLIFAGSYFEVSKDAQPLLHYWSLSVEEQFYVFFPLTLALLSRVKRFRTALILIATAASFASCVILTKASPVWAFYLLPTRGWELLFGALIALLHFNGHALKG